MKTIARTPSIRSCSLLFSLLFGLLFSLVGAPPPALASCGGVTNVSDETELNNSIAAFNGESGPCHYTIAFSNDIFLTASTTTIDNPAENVDLLIAGNGYFVSGPFLEGVRPFTIANDTTVTMQNITIGGGAVAINGGGIHNNGNLTLNDTIVTLNSAGEEGGGVWNGALGTLTIENGSQVENNGAFSANAVNDAQGGGGIFNNGGTVNITDSLISGNIVEGTDGPDDGGGGIFNDGRNTPGAVILDNTTLSDNTALTAGIGAGGGILNVGDADSTPTVTVTGGLVDGNQAARAGGGIATNQGAVALQGVSLSNNSATLNGGGLHLTGAATVTITTGAIQANNAGVEGGGLWLPDDGAARVTIIGSSIVDNTAIAGGGGIFNDGASGDLYVENSTLSGNTVTLADGGGLDSEGGTVTLVAVTIAGNAAAGNGGGINADPGVLLHTKATLIGDNSAAAAPDVDGAFTAAVTTLLENAAGAGGITNGADGNIVGLDPRLLPLDNYGGPIPLHALDDDSPALDAAADTGLNVDQRGVSRPQGAADDIGAYEQEIPALYLPIFLTN